MSKLLKFVNGQMYEYEIYNLVDQYDPVLKEVLPEFDFTNPPVDPRYLAVSLIQTMAKHGGVGMAANQVGLRHRVFVMGAGASAFACFNPEILQIFHVDKLKSSGDPPTEDAVEGCLSFPGLYLKVNRSKRIDVRFTDMNGIIKTQTFEGLTARIFQHELDHLNGITFTTKVSSIKLSQARNKVKTNLKKMKRAKEQMKQQQKLNVKQETNTVTPQKFVLNTDALK